MRTARTHDRATGQQRDTVLEHGGTGAGSHRRAHKTHHRACIARMFAYSAGWHSFRCFQCPVVPVPPAATCPHLRVGSFGCGRVHCPVSLLNACQTHDRHLRGRFLRFCKPTAAPPAIVRRLRALATYRDPVTCTKNVQGRRTLFRTCFVKM